jgi:hypothetical protein
MEFPENDAAAPPEPEPAALAPLDSASPDAGDPDFANPNPTNSDAADPDSTNPFSTNNDAQQILDSLVTDVVAAGTSLPSSSPDDDELTAPPTPKPRPKTRKSPKSKAKSRVRGPKRPQPTPLERHARKCSICRHPLRQMIEEAFLHWRSPQTIMHCFDIQTETTIYHHAHAFNFFALRNRNLQSALANIVETIDTCDFTGAEMLDAVRALAHLSEDGRWIHSTSKSEFMNSMQRLPAVAGLPAAQPALPAHTNALPTGAGDEILIASGPNIKKPCKPLKTILSYSG